MALSLNTKQDYLNYLTVDSEETKKALQLLLDTRFIWKTTAILAANAAGVNDSTHRVIGEEPERIWLYRRTVIRWKAKSLQRDSADDHCRSEERNKENYCTGG